MLSTFKPLRGPAATVFPGVHGTRVRVLGAAIAAVGVLLLSVGASTARGEPTGAGSEPHAEKATAVTSTAATMNGRLRLGPGQESECQFEYGLTESDLSSVPCVIGLPVEDSEFVDVSARLMGLMPGTQYVFRLTGPGGPLTDFEPEHSSREVFATLPGPRYYNNGGLINTGEKVPVIGWGTLTLSSAAGRVTCHTANAGFVENQEGGGVGEAEAFASYKCESRKWCPAGATTELVAERLPWASVLEQVGGANRVSATGVKEAVVCIVSGKKEGGGTFVTNQEGTCCQALSPAARNGTSALHPSFFEFGAESGELEGEGSHGSVVAGFEGELKTWGFAAQELVSVKP